MVTALVAKITAEVVAQFSSWLSFKDVFEFFKGSQKRIGFRHELELLSTILKYFINYNDEVVFQFPIKQRHRDAVWICRKKSTSSKDLSVEEFYSFREELLKQKRGALFATLATVQYFQALRISEAAALYREDIKLNAEDPSKSRLHVKRAVVWLRQKGLKSFVQDGFKNAEANEGIKEQPLFPESYETLRSYFDQTQNEARQGLVFATNDTHRTIQYAYDHAFEEAGLPYRGTHIMRHGGCRHLYNMVPDTAVAQQLLGNTSLEATLVYAKRHKSALTQVSQALWDQKDKERSGEFDPVRGKIARVRGKETHVQGEKTAEGGCNWLQTPQPKLKLVNNR